MPLSSAAGMTFTAFKSIGSFTVVPRCISSTRCKSVPYDGMCITRYLPMSLQVQPNRTRGIATQPPFIHLPPPPPREFNPDGTPKKYRLNQRIYDHHYDWERWTIRPAGVFHTVYYGEFARDLPPIQAWLLQYPLGVAFIPYFLFCFACVFLFNSINTIGIKPKRYTIEWMIASKERDRAENTNAVTRYLDRRRKERGSHWLMEHYLPTHPFFLHMRNHHDEELKKQTEDSTED